MEASRIMIFYSELLALDNFLFTDRFQLPQSINERIISMKIKNFIYAVCEQLFRHNAWSNIFITHDSFGIFSKYSHISRRSNRPKVSFSSRVDAQKAADTMGKKYGVHFSVYKCAWCDGWHIGKNSRNKYDIDFKKESEKAGFINHPNILYEKLKHLRIADFAPVYGNGVRGRTLSGCGNVKLLHAIRDAGIKVVIDLRTQDHTNRFEQDVVKAGLEYFHIPIDKNGTDVHEIISALPELFNWLDKGYYYMACAMGLHRTDIALALYYVFHPLVDYSDVPEMRGYRNVEKRNFKCDNIAARLNSIMKEATSEELTLLGLGDDYEMEFLKRKKRLFDMNRKF